MAKGMTKEEKYRQMIETPVNRLIPRLAVPTIISMLVTSIYNMADTFFVSQISTSASGRRRRYVFSHVHDSGNRFYPGNGKRKSYFPLPGESG